MKFNDNFVRKFTNALTSKNQHKDIDEILLPPIKEMRQDLIKINDEY